MKKNVYTAVIEQSGNETPFVAQQVQFCTFGFAMSIALPLYHVQFFSLIHIKNTED